MNEKDRQQASLITDFMSPFAPDLKDYVEKDGNLNLNDYFEGLRDLEKYRKSRNTLVVDRLERVNERILRGEGGRFISKETAQEHDNRLAEESLEATSRSGMDIRSLALEARRAKELGDRTTLFTIEDEIQERLIEQTERNGWNIRQTDDALQYFIDIIYGKETSLEAAVAASEVISELAATEPRISIDVDKERAAVREEIDKGHLLSLEGMLLALDSLIEKAVSNGRTTEADALDEIQLELRYAIDDLTQIDVILNSVAEVIDQGDMLALRAKFKELDHLVDEYTKEKRLTRDVDALRYLRQELLYTMLEKQLVVIQGTSSVEPTHSSIPLPVSGGAGDVALVATPDVITTDDEAAAPYPIVNLDDPDGFTPWQDLVDDSLTIPPIVGGAGDVVLVPEPDTITTDDEDAPLDPVVEEENAPHTRFSGIRQKIGAAAAAAMYSLREASATGSGLDLVEARSKKSVATTGTTPLEKESISSKKRTIFNVVGGTALFAVLFMSNTERLTDNKDINSDLLNYTATEVANDTDIGAVNPGYTVTSTPSPSETSGATSVVPESPTATIAPTDTISSEQTNVSAGSSIGNTSSGNSSKSSENAPSQGKPSTPATNEATNDTLEIEDVNIYVEVGSGITPEIQQYVKVTYGIDLSANQLKQMYIDLIKSGRYTPQQLFGDVEFYDMGDGWFGMKDPGPAVLTGTGRIAIRDWLAINLPK